MVSSDSDLLCIVQTRFQMFHISDQGFQAVFSLILFHGIFPICPASRLRYFCKQLFNILRDYTPGLRGKMYKRKKKKKLPQKELVKAKSHSFRETKQNFYIGKPEISREVFLGIFCFIPVTVWSLFVRYFIIILGLRGGSVFEIMRAITKQGVQGRKIKELTSVISST